MAKVMPTHIEPLDAHNQRKAQLKIRIACSKLADPAFKQLQPTLIFNLSMEPAFLFNLTTFADKGDDLMSRTSYKL